MSQSLLDILIRKMVKFDRLGHEEQGCQSTLVNITAISLDFQGNSTIHGTARRRKV